MSEPQITRKGLFAVRSDSSEIVDVHILEEIGDGWLGGITDKDFAALLKPLAGVPLNIHIDSPGGDVFQGIAIANMLAAHDAKTTGYIKGIAASIASVIATSVDTLVAPDNTMMMIHDPWSMAMGNASEMRSQADILDKAKELILNSYMRKSTVSREELSAMMSREEWLTAEEAAAIGLVDEVRQSGRQPSAPAALARFEGAFHRIPQNLLASALEARAGMPANERLPTWEHHCRKDIASLRAARMQLVLRGQRRECEQKAAEAAPVPYETRLRREIQSIRKGKTP